MDAGRRRNLHSDGGDAFIFQPIVNYRTLEFARPLSARQIGKIVDKWAEFSGINEVKDKGRASEDESTKAKRKKKKRLRLSPHDLRRTAVTRALDLGFTYRQVQMMSGHKDIRMVVRYDHEREKMEQSAINFLYYDEEGREGNRK